MPVFHFFGYGGVWGEGVTKVVRRLSGGLMVTFGDWGQSEQLKDLTSIDDVPIKVEVCLVDSAVWGVVSYD
ncbi:hypothetical protein Hamer_G003167 [Homarus americanus]|uniref:Uncharacterized protein n=1 Tax=Homarus americanus TaxID=6706 RepID=A0A8J5TG18_HOMAM|nr:hypothetical protein Hamer_G003167 [Homarus americanus]